MARAAGHARLTTSNRVWIQLKGRKSALRQHMLNEPHLFRTDRPAPQRYVSYSTPTKLLNYALRCGFPLLLFVADLQAEDIFWLPLRDEIETNLDRRTPAWRNQRTATLPIPIENSLRAGAALATNGRLPSTSRCCPGLRHYALEPTRQVAFSVMHTIHRQLRYQANFSPFQQVSSAETHVNHPDLLLTALDAAELGLNRVLGLDVVFGRAGVAPQSITQQMRAAIVMCQELRVRVPKTSIAPMDVARKTLDISHGIEMISAIIAAYHEIQYRWLTFEDGVSQSIGVLRE